jgi:DNA-binding NarL/FixJ family response regulator
MKHGAARRAQEAINLPKDKLDDIEYYLLGSKLMMHEIAEELGVSLSTVKKVNRSLAKI